MRAVSVAVSIDRDVREDAAAEVDPELRAVSWPAATLREEATRERVKVALRAECGLEAV